MKFLFGTHADLHDHRDLPYVPPRKLIRRRPRKVDLRSGMPPVYHQGGLASCSANAIAAVMWYEMRRTGLEDTHEPSRLFIYYNERAREGLIGSNAPVSLRDGYRSVGKRGACHERLWPYNEDRYARRPPPHCYRSGYTHRAVRYMRISQDLHHMRACVAHGFPFTFGMTVYESFRSAKVRKTGIVPLPKKSEKTLGGHAMVVVGYDDAKRRFIVRNSWGGSWGEGGYCHMPYDYMLDSDRAWDFWTARWVTRRHK